MSARDRILAKVRSQLGSAADDPERRAAIAARLTAKVRHPLPARVAEKPHDELIALFRRFLEGQSAKVVEVDGQEAIPSAIAAYLRQTNLPARLRSGEDPYLDGLPWSREPALVRDKGRARPADEVGLSRATAGVAETGTLLVASGADNPVTINFLPETHIVVVRADDIVASYEDAWGMIRQRFGERGMPRTVNMISGPSRTGDIGGKLVMGAHGPRRMCVVIVRSGTRS